MFDIQDKTTGTFFDIPDSEKLQITITSSLFETKELSGASGYELVLADSPKNALLFQFIKQMDSSSKFVGKKEVIIWLDGTPWNDAVMTLRAVKKNGYQVFLSLGISAFIDQVLDTNIKSLNWPNNGKYHLLKEFNDLKYAIFGNNIAETENIQLDFETSKTQGIKSFSITNLIHEYYSGTFYYFKKSELNATIAAMQVALVVIYATLPEDPEFEFSLSIEDASATHAILELDGTTFTMSKIPKLKVTGINIDTPYYLLSPLRIDILNFTWSGGLDFSGNVNIGGINVGYTDYEYEETKDYSIQKEMKLMSDYSRTVGNQFPFVFAPFNNIDFFKTKPDSFSGQINAFDVNHTYIQDSTLKYGCYFTNKQADSDLFEKHLVSPQLRLAYILERLQITFPDTFNFDSIFNNEDDRVTKMLSVVALYTIFSINQKTPANIAETTFVSYLQKEVQYSDLLPSKRVIDLLLVVKNNFGMSLDFDFNTNKIKMKTYTEIFEQEPEDISKYVEIVHEKEKAPYDSLALSFTVDSNDDYQKEFINPDDYVFLGEIPYSYRSPLGGPVTIQLLQEEFGIYFFEILEYIKANEIVYDEIKDPKWFTKIIAKITDHGFYLYDTSVESDVSHTAWKYIGTEKSDFQEEGSAPLEIILGSSFCSITENPDEGYATVPIAKQRGNLRNTSGLFKPLEEDYNNDFEFRLFTFDYWKHYLISDGDIDVLHPFAKPLVFSKDLEPSINEFTYNLPLFDFFYKKLDSFLKNTDKLPVRLKVNSLFLKTYDPTKIYKIGSQHFLFKELRVEIPKKKLGNNERYSAEADVYIIRNYSV